MKYEKIKCGFRDFGVVIHNDKNMLEESFAIEPHLYVGGRHLKLEEVQYVSDQLLYWLDHHTLNGGPSRVISSPCGNCGVAKEDDRPLCWPCWRKAFPDTQNSLCPIPPRVLPVDPVVPDGWTRDRPTEPGLWLMRVPESHVEPVEVFRRNYGRIDMSIQGVAGSFVLSNPNNDSDYFAPDVEWKRVAGPKTKQETT